MNLVVDLGNTASKIGLFESNKLVKSFVVPLQKRNLDGLDIEFSKIEKCAVCNVRSKTDELLINLQETFNCLLLNHNTAIPIKNCYQTPKTLGKDRLCNALGAWKIFPHQNSLVVDFGTCIKYDIVNSKGEYLGGSISLGMKMRFKALHNNTAQLPLLDPKNNVPLIGNTTKTSIQSGVMKGIETEVSGIISQYQQLFTDLNILFTGGDHSYFAEAFKNGIFALPNLTLEGLHSIL